MKKILPLVLALTMLFCAFALSSCNSNSGSNAEQSKTQKEEEFYNLVDETKDLLEFGIEKGVKTRHAVDITLAMD